MGSTASLNSPRIEPYYYSVFSFDNLDKNQQLCSRRESAAKAFSKYIKNGFWMNTIITASPSLPVYLDNNTTLQYGFVIPDGMKLVFATSPRSSVRTSPSRTFNDCYITNAQASMFSMDELRLILLSTINDYYLASNVHQQWKKDGSIITSSFEDSIEDNENLEPSPSDLDTENAITILLSVAAHFDEEEYVRFLREQNWADQIVNMMENFQVAFTISSSDSEKGFPLLFANKAWEKLTQYSLQEKKGKSSINLILDTDALDSIPSTENLRENKEATMLKDALCRGSSIKVGLPCARKSGTFFNLLGVAPIHRYNSENNVEYRGVLMVHCEGQRSGAKYFSMGSDGGDGALGSPLKTVRVGENEFKLAEEVLRLFPFLVKL